MIFADSHVHTSTSPDSHGDPIETCEKAIEKGITVLTLTEHFECYASPRPAESESAVFALPYLKEYQATYQKLKEKFLGALDLRFGLELGQPHTNPSLSKAALEGFAFDYVIGSGHKVRDLDLGYYHYTEDNIRSLQKESLDVLFLLASQDDFDCLGHFDLIRRYANRDGIDADYHPFADKVDEILKMLISRGKGLEINTSGLRRKLKDTMPAFWILKRYRKLGGEILTLGSDSHLPKDVGEGIFTAADAAKAAGFSYITVFKNRKPEWYPLD